jgi:hypothetical protein
MSEIYALTLTIPLSEFCQDGTRRNAYVATFPNS